MFFTIQVTDNGQVNQTIYQFPTIEAAKANHYYFISYCYSNTDLNYFMGAIMDQNGCVRDSEVWHKPENS